LTFGLCKACGPLLSSWFAGLPACLGAVWPCGGTDRFVRVFAFLGNEIETSETDAGFLCRAGLAGLGASGCLAVRQSVLARPDFRAPAVRVLCWSAVLHGMAPCLVSALTVIGCGRYDDRRRWLLGDGKQGVLAWPGWKTVGCSIVKPIALRSGAETRRSGRTRRYLAIPNGDSLAWQWCAHRVRRCAVSGQSRGLGEEAWQKDGCRMPRTPLPRPHPMPLPRSRNQRSCVGETSTTTIREVFVFSRAAGHSSFSVIGPES